MTIVSSGTPATKLDGYKVDHRRQYPKKTKKVVSNLTARGTRVKFRGKLLRKIRLFGLQYFTKNYLIDDWNNNFFSKPIEEVCRKYRRRINNYLGPKNKVGDDHIRALHKLGYLPLEIWSLPEGAAVNLRVPMFLVWNTHEDFYWLTNAIETLLSVTIWLPCTSATTATLYRNILDDWAMKTNPEMIGFTKWQGHDFSMRGHSSFESSKTSGGGHLLEFFGTDTVPAIDWLEDFYNADSDKELVGGSVAATEHSVQCLGSAEYQRLIPSEVDGDTPFLRYVKGKDYVPSQNRVTLDESERLALGELLLFKYLITEVYPDGICSVVSDTWDLWKVVDPENGLCKNLYEVIMARDGKLVIRPDSGDPVEIVCGIDIEDYTKLSKTLEEAKRYAEDTVRRRVKEETDHGELGSDEETEIFRYEGKVYQIKVNFEWNRYDKQYYYLEQSRVTGFEEIQLTNQQKGVVECLYEIFGATKTSTEYLQLDSHIGAIYGDSITLARADEICARLAKKGFASTNMVFGIGSFTYQGAITPEAIITRDTHMFAVKSTFGEIEIEGAIEGIEIFKDPKTDSGMKKSAKGLIAVYKDGDDYRAKDQATWEEVFNCAFVQVFLNSRVTRDWTLAEVRAEVEKVRDLT